MEAPRVLISVCTRDHILANTVQWMLDAREGREEQFGIDIVYTMDPIDTNRNIQVERFLKADPAYDFIFFLDSDAAPMRGTIDALLAWEKPVTVAPNLIWDHAQRRVELMVYDDADGLKYSRPTSAFERITGSGMSGLLVARAVFEKLSAPWFLFEYDPETHRIAIGEDVHFYRSLAAAGVEVWCDFALVQHHQKNINLRKVWEAQQVAHGHGPNCAEICRPGARFNAR